jgi:hypothetical protein
MPGHSATRGIALAKLSIEQALARAKSHAKRGEVVAAQVLYAGIMKAFPNNKKHSRGAGHGPQGVYGVSIYGLCQ